MPSTKLRANRSYKRSYMPIVSVIVPNYNHGRYLRQRIDTIFAQTFKDFELILLDDCSTDESRSILREYSSDPRVQLEFNDVNSGSPFKQWNKGVRLAQGKYIWMAESDDYAAPRFLERLAAALDANPKTAFAYCRSWRTTDSDRVEGFADYNLPDPERWTADFCIDGRELCQKYFALITPVPNASSVVFRKDVYEQVGGADESLRLCGDWKLWASMALHGNVAYLCEPLNYFRYHDNTARGMTERDGTSAREYLHVSRWVLGRVTVPEAELEKICEAQAKGWVPVVLSFRTPLALKRAILRSVRALDPHPFRRVPGPALSTVRRKIQRHWRDVRSLLTAIRP
jgi:glycosyltransferase involved in cell wall biosynthesis